MFVKFYLLLHQLATSTSWAATVKPVFEVTKILTGVSVASYVN